MTLEQINQLIPEQLQQVLDFAKSLTTPSNSWPKYFFTEVVGALADEDTFFRHPQGSYEIREHME